MTSRAPLQTVLVTSPEYESWLPLLRERFPDVTFDMATGDNLAQRIADADAMMAGWLADPGLLDLAPRLRWIQSFGAGVEGIVDERFAERGITLTNGSGVMSSNMAEHVIGIMLAFARCLHTLWDAQKEHAWKSGVGRETVFELRDQTAILVGVGRIGRDIARRLKAFDMRVIGVRRSDFGDELPDGFDRMVPIGEMRSVLGEGDHVISSLPHTRETIGLFDAAVFEQFRTGAYFYNLGRGTSVVQDDLIEAVHAGKLGGAGLDVVTPEPLPADNPLWDMPNVILTGHTAGATPRFAARVIDLFLENLRRYQEGEPLLNVVEVTRGY